MEGIRKMSKDKLFRCVRALDDSCDHSKDCIHYHEHLENQYCSFAECFTGDCPAGCVAIKKDEHVRKEHKQSLKKTVVIQISNSDDKLSQREWSSYVDEMRFIAEDDVEGLIKFSGGSYTDSPWQDYCVILEMREHDIERLKKSLHNLCTKYKQASVAFLVGDVQFI
jgi:hypothetical protein